MPRLVDVLRGIPRLRRPPRRAEVPEQRIRNRVPARLARIPRPHDGADPGIRLEGGHVDAASRENHEGDGRAGGDGGEHLGDEIRLRTRTGRGRLPATQPRARRDRCCGKKR